MNEYQIIVKFAGVVLFQTEWHVGPKEARDTAWLRMMARTLDRRGMCNGHSRCFKKAGSNTG